MLSFFLQSLPCYFWYSPQALQEIKQLQMHLHQEKSTRFLLEKAIGRASSTLSPGHRHFSAQCRSGLQINMMLHKGDFICGSCEKTSKSRAPFLQRSSTSSVLGPKAIREEHEWPSRSIIEVLSIKLDKRCPRASYTISNYRFLVEQLERVDLSVMENSAKLAFWINVYNSLIMHAYLVYGVPSSSLRRVALFNKAAYNIGGQVITANCIEYSILGCRTSRMGRWLETILSNATRKKSGEDKQLIWSKMGLPSCHPLVFFAICTGASSDPILRVYSAKNVTEELEKAKKEFLRSHVVVKKSNKVFLPKVLDRYAKEVCTNYDSLLMWVCESMDKKQQDAIHRCVDSNCRRKASQVIEWLPYDTRFRYALTSESVETPCKL
ncbi:hypothetical protein ZIOFF_034853 [Zingiber officinale]|uniref:DUF547 domain-containing protein n=1 Tax=Zingiber officinale TaxID=94328 RepID=A0A8J5L011_ZINOF|nr:hypothetical protein ZIOFF_034853 [Zingiber officinale]